jgi:hypothetical protein
LDIGDADCDESGDRGEEEEEEERASGVVDTGSLASVANGAEGESSRSCCVGVSSSLLLVDRRVSGDLMMVNLYLLVVDVEHDQKLRGSEESQDQRSNGS